MNRFAASILALSLAATAAGNATAQSVGNAPAYGDRPVVNDTPYYEYAKVVRVDPVLQSGYRTTPTSSQRCWTEEGGYASDDRYSDRRYDDRYDDRYGDRRYDDRYNDRYGNDRYGSQTGRNVATVLGGIVGAALGSKVGGGSARYSTAAIGSMVGGMAGREIYETSQRNKQRKMPSVTVCDPIRDGDDRNYSSNESVSAYDVTYEYAGRRYTTRTDHHPGERIRVRVDVRAE
jgi:uncharacterized protein YcfJ